MAVGTVLGLVGMGLKVFGGLKNINKGNKERDKALNNAAAAQAELEQLKAQFMNLDNSNPYLNLENMYKDMKLNTQESEFTRQQQMKNQANILQQLRTGAGTSGIAALAQSLANQGSLDAQKAAASIGTQEQAIQEKVMTEASRIQDLEREGEIISRQAQHGKLSAMMGMSASEVAAANQAAAAGEQQTQAGWGQMAGGVFDFFGSLNPTVPQQQVQ